MRAQGRRVNSGVNRVCAHWGPGEPAPGDAQCAEWLGRGRAPGVLCVPRWCASAAWGCRRTECEGPWVPGARRGTACVRPCPGRVCLPRSGVRLGCVLTPGSSLGPRVRLRALALLGCSGAGLPPLASTGSGPPAATPPLQCRRHPPRAGAAPHRSGAPRGPAAEWSSAAVRARSQEPAARSLALARLPARPLLLEFKVTTPSALSTPGSGAALRGSESEIPKRGRVLRGVVVVTNPSLTIASPWTCDGEPGVPTRGAPAPFILFSL